MKYLKSINELIVNKTGYSLPKKTINELRDICLEIEDLGYTTILHRFPFGDRRSFIMIKFNGKHFDYDLKECCLRLKDYLGENYLDFKYRWDKFSKEIQLTENTELKNHVHSVIIGFKI